MTTASDFAPEELKTIQLAPVLVIGAAAASEPGGPLSIMKEMMGGISGLGQSLQGNSSELVTELFKNIDEKNYDDDEINKLDTPDARQKLIDKSLPAARSAFDIISERGSKEDADAFAQALLNAAQGAVRAAKTGSFLGFGGTKVTEAEAAYVKNLANALGYREA